MTDRRLRVLVLASTFPRWRGDTEPPFVYNLSDRLAQRFDVTVLAPHAANAKTAERWGDLEIRRFRYFWPDHLQKLAYGGILPNLKRNRLLWLLVPFFFLGEFIAALRLARSIRPDVLHAHWVIPQGVVAVLVGWLTRTPVLTTCHAGDIYALQGRLQNSLKRWVLSRSSYVTAVSRSLMEAATALGFDGSEASSVISMGVDTSRFHPTKRDESLRARLGACGPLILFVGRLAEKKGVRYLLEAMPEVLREFPDTTLAIVGDGPLRSELEEMADSLGIARRVRFVGAVPNDDLPVYYASADVFVGPSIVTDDGDREGLPTTLVEALASGCAVVSSDVGGANEAIVHDQTGLLVADRAPQSIADGIYALLADQALKGRVCHRGLQWVAERFNQNVVADRYAEVILQLEAASQ